MLKYLMACGLLLALPVLGSAQETTGGIRGGLNFSSFNAEDINIDSDVGVGVHLMGFYQRALSDALALQPEIGASLEGDDDFSITAINTALLLKLYAIDELYLQSGIQAGFLIAEDDDEGIEDFSTTDFNVSLPLGFGYQFSSFLGADVRYNLGLTDISTAEAFEITNSTLQVGVTLSL
jgi:hypothetical protein